MSWIAVLLLGLAVCDLARSIRPTKSLNELIGAFVAVWWGLVAGMTGLIDVLALAVIAAVVVLWGQAVSRAFAGVRPWLPLLLLGSAVLAGVLTSPWADPSGGLLEQWLDATRVPLLQGISADRALMMVGAFLVQLSTGNVIVRLVLNVTGTTSPAQEHTAADPAEQLKGGRLLGPMERVFIVGLGLAGQLTAASIVVAAKGLLRWPELHSSQEQHLIHRLTEYFLVGSFVSWLVALASLVLLA